MAVSPGKNQLWIDPALGRFILPRPAYWSRMGSEDEILDPVIGSGTPVFEQNANYFVQYGPGKWGNCLRLQSNSRFAGTNYLHPLGSGQVFNTGTMSFWINMNDSFGVSQSCRIHFGGVSNYVLVADGKVALVINGVTRLQRNLTLQNTGQWHHVYCIWDKDAGLSGGLRIRFFIDGIELLTAVDDWSMGSLYLAFFIGDTAFVSVNIQIDNLKIWNHVVTEDPSFEWNGGAGRENALHVIYGADEDPEYDYRPKLTGSGNGVGYYFMP
jgi:hypothetical protein